MIWLIATVLVYLVMSVTFVRGVAKGCGDRAVWF